MAFEDNLDLLQSIPTGLSVEIMTPRQSAVIEMLGKIDKKAEQLYTAGLFFLKNTSFPAREHFICFSFFFLAEILLDSDELEEFANFEKKTKEDWFSSIKAYGGFEDDICKEIIERPANNCRIKNLWQELTNLAKDKSYKWHFFIKKFRPKIKDHDLDDMVSKIKSVVKEFHSGRHFNKTPRAGIDYDKNIGIVEDFILNLEQPYLEAKEVLDGILADTNTRAD